METGENCPEVTADGALEIFDADFLKVSESDNPEVFVRNDPEV